MSLLTVSDVAALLNVRTKKVLDLIHAHAINAVNISPKAKRKTWRIDPDELRAFRERQQVVPERERQRQHRFRNPGVDVIEFMK